MQPVRSPSIPPPAFTPPPARPRASEDLSDDDDEGGGDGGSAPRARARAARLRLQRLLAGEVEMPAAAGRRVRAWAPTRRGTRRACAWRERGDQPHRSRWGRSRCTYALASTGWTCCSGQGATRAGGCSDILGVEAAGTVARTAGSLSVGTPVAALLDGGGYAEFVRVPAAQCIDLRAVTGGSGEHARALTWAEAGAVPEAWCAAHQLLRWVGQVRQGDTVLVHAGASGVGTAAVQLARGAGAARVVATASSAERRRACVELGATHVAPSRGLDDSRGVWGVASAKRSSRDVCRAHARVNLTCSD